MSRKNTTNASVNAIAETAAKAKKSAAKNARANVKKAGVKPDPKPVSKPAQPAATESKPAAKKEGLRKPQVRILEALANASGPLNRRQIAETASVDVAWMTEYLGGISDEQNAKTEARMGFRTLYGLGYAKEVVIPAKDESGKPSRGYQVTPAGRKALKALSSK